jgi:hypothetical protein
MFKRVQDTLMSKRSRARTRGTQERAAAPVKQLSDAQIEKQIRARIKKNGLAVEEENVQMGRYKTEKAREIFQKVKREMEVERDLFTPYERKQESKPRFATKDNRPPGLAQITSSREMSDEKKVHMVRRWTKKHVLTPELTGVIDKTQKLMAQGINVKRQDPQLWERFLNARKEVGNRMDAVIDSLSRLGSAGRVDIDQFMRFVPAEEGVSIRSKPKNKVRQQTLAEEERLFKVALGSWRDRQKFFSGARKAGSKTPSIPGSSARSEAGQLDLELGRALNVPYSGTGRQRVPSSPASFELNFETDQPGSLKGLRIKKTDPIRSIGRGEPDIKLDPKSFAEARSASAKSFDPILIQKINRMVNALGDPDIDPGVLSRMRRQVQNLKAREPSVPSKERYNIGAEAPSTETTWSGREVPREFEERSNWQRDNELALQELMQLNKEMAPTPGVSGGVKRAIMDMPGVTFTAEGRRNPPSFQKFLQNRQLMEKLISRRHGGGEGIMGPFNFPAARKQKADLARLFRIGERQMGLGRYAGKQVGQNIPSPEFLQQVGNLVGQSYGGPNRPFFTAANQSIWQRILDLAGGDPTKAMNLLGSLSNVPSMI